MSVICPCPCGLKASTVREGRWRRKERRKFLPLKPLLQTDQGCVWLVWDCSKNQSVVNPPAEAGQKASHCPASEMAAVMIHFPVLIFSPFRTSSIPTYQEKRGYTQASGFLWFNMSLDMMRNYKTVEISSKITNLQMFQTNTSALCVATHITVDVYEKHGIFTPVWCSCHCATWNFIPFCHAEHTTPTFFKTRLIEIIYLYLISSLAFQL